MLKVIFMTILKITLNGILKIVFKNILKIILKIIFMQKSSKKTFKEKNLQNRSSKKKNNFQ